MSNGGNHNYRLSPDFLAAVVIAGLFAAVPLGAYAENRGIYGAFAAPKLFFLVGFGMSAGAACLAGRGRRVLATIPGLLAGLTSVALYLYVPAIAALDEAFPRKWMVIVLVLGAIPGFVLYGLLGRFRGDS